MDTRKRCTQTDEDVLLRQASTGDLDTAEDAAQENFINAFQNMPGFRGGSFRGMSRNTIHDEQPIFDLATHYRIELPGRIDTQWPQSSGTSTERINDEMAHCKDMTEIKVHTDQSGGRRADPPHPRFWD